MSYIVVTHWKTKSGPHKDENWRTIQQKYVPALKALGATDVYGVEASETEAIMIVTYPDRTTRDTAQARIQEMRQKATSELQSELTGEFGGEVKVSG